MDILWQELTAGFPDRARLAVVLIRVIAATLLGAIVGLQREKAGKPAGLRTHMLVSPRNRGRGFGLFRQSAWISRGYRE